MKVINVTSSTYIDFNEENIKESSKFKIDDNVRISKYKNIFVKSCFKLFWRSVYD